MIRIGKIGKHEIQSWNVSINYSQRLHATYSNNFEVHKYLHCDQEKQK
jgi:hypothetical protein